MGTRPEVIKMAPIIHALRQAQWAQVRICATAQHREMLDAALSIFGILPDIDLNAMRPNQTLCELTALLLSRIANVLTLERPDMVIAQGDTTTVLCTALACFYQKIPFAHVEAGLRTGDINNPFPEEMNRIVAGRLSTIHFAPTERAQANLLAEGVEPKNIHVTGNTVIDALIWTAARNPDHGMSLPSNKRHILLTTHRRENFGQSMGEIFRAVNTLSTLYSDIHFIYPVHPNPNVTKMAYETLGKNANVTLCAPLDYDQLVGVLQAVEFVLTDSGGLQEEAPALGKHVLVLRDATERPEVVELGMATLVGTNHDNIVDAAKKLLAWPLTSERTLLQHYPYGDGSAANRIVGVLTSHFCQ